MMKATQVLNNPFVHTLTLRVYYEDTDAGGVVYYANYLRFAERARTEMIRGLLQREGPLWTEQDPVFVVRRVEADYLAPARLDDCLTVTTMIEEMGGASLTMSQTIGRGETALVRLKVILVAVGHDGKVLRIPPEWRQTLSRFVKEGAASPHGTASS